MSELLRVLIETVQEERRQSMTVQRLKREQQKITDDILDVLGIELPSNN